MRLADFIEQNLDAILKEWVAFAAESGAAGETLDLKALRDHAVPMLEVIIADLRTPQTHDEQKAKSKGQGERVAGSEDTAAEVHGAGRAEEGFTIAEMVSEYRALRASVLRLWTQSEGTLTAEDLEDLTRFNETIDQSLAESTQRFARDFEKSRDLFMGILGHDLRSPLSAVISGSEFMLDDQTMSPERRAIGKAILSSAKRMNRMVADLLDFTRGRLGSGIPLTRAQADLGDTIRTGIDEVVATHPDRPVTFTPTGDLTGSWDTGRIGQLISNLVNNAVQHGNPESRVDVSASGERDDVVVRVHNDGAPIPAASLPDIFSPFKRLKPGAPATNTSGNMGLGLYIAERIVTAHGGTIEVRSSDEAGTLFTVRIPRK
ncbi:MAG: ATP-binding protein [Gemmatimonadaceae bacterium]